MLFFSRSIPIPSGRKESVRIFSDWLQIEALSTGRETAINEKLALALAMEPRILTIRSPLELLIKASTSSAVPETITFCEKSPVSNRSPSEIESRTFFCWRSKIRLEEFRQASRYWGPEILIAGKILDNARGSTGKTDGKSILIA